jgi:hypothetical protein
MAGFAALGPDRSGSAGFVVGGGLFRFPQAYWAPMLRSNELVRGQEVVLMRYSTFGISLLFFT